MIMICNNVKKSSIFQKLCAMLTSWYQFCGVIHQCNAESTCENDLKKGVNKMPRYSKNSWIVRIGGWENWWGGKMSGVDCACCRKGGRELVRDQDGEWMGWENGWGGKMSGMGSACHREGNVIWSNPINRYNDVWTRERQVWSIVHSLLAKSSRTEHCI